MKRVTSVSSESQAEREVARYIKKGYNATYIKEGLHYAVYVQK